MSHKVNNVAYEGTVHVRVVDNGHTCYSTTLKNRGTGKLFEFLSLCLLGLFTKAKPLVPTKLRLLYNSPTGERQACSSFVSLSKAPTSDVEGDTAAAVLSFTVPYAYIYSATENGDDKPFNQIALYSAAETDINEMCAYYDITAVEAASMNPASWSQTSLLIIDWELQLSNKSDT